MYAVVQIAVFSFAFLLIFTFFLIILHNLVFLPALYGIKSLSRRRKKKKKKKYYNPENNYFRNSPEHVDMQDDYINAVWEKIDRGK